MKKITLTVAAVLAFAFSNAQTTKFGIKGGLNVSNFSGDVEDNSALVGFNVGGFVEIKVSDKFAVQPELLFSTQGAKNEFTEPGGYKVDSKLTLGYINVPVMLKYYAAEKFSLEAGPQIGFLVSAKSKADITDGGTTVTVKEDSKDQFKSIDFGMNFGAGYDFTENLSAGLRYNLGLSNIADVEAGDDFKLKNSVFSVSLGYKF
ncbi:porin family protein [Flavobacterium frigoris]|uniref:Outer membrane protein beta-barrel domain-containing protein n=1 Tax=Flavobacterium frigoris TaxID=229204 RepID=A0A1H9LSI2_FLAFI|nr:porin family protein [Flavobacterium frigoris]SER13803.1 Outer membrane protein beta-barrel domain-containing protein [Flavobacterium frigoris]